MSILTRIKDVVAADLHRVLDEKERKNPTAMLNQFIRNCEKEVKKVELLVAEQKQTVSAFYQEKEHALYMAKKRAHQVDIAMKANEAELEKRAQEEAVYYSEHAERLTELYEQGKKDEAGLKLQLQDMKMKLKDMHDRRAELMNREQVIHQANHYHPPMYESMASRTAANFDHVEKKINRLEEMVAEDYERMSFDQRMAELEKTLNEEQKEEAPADKKVN